MKLATKIAYNTIIQIIGKIISTALGLVSVGMIARYLGTNGFGEYTTILTFISFFAIIADLGLTLVTVQLISQPNCDENRILGNLLGLRLVSALIFIGLAPISVFFFPYAGAIKIGVVIASLSFFFIAQNQILVGLFQKRLRMDKVSIAEVVNRFALIFMIILVIKLDSGLTGIILATVLASLINFLIHYFYSRQFVKIKLQFDFQYWKEIIQKTWPLAVTIVFNLIYLKTDTLLLSIIRRKSDIGIIAEVGLYGAAYKVIDVLITFPFMFAGIVLPVMTAAWANKDREGFKKILQKAFDVMAIIAVPLAIGTQLVATQVITLIMGNEFAMAGPILQVLIFAASCIFLGNMFAHAVIAIDKQREIISAYVFVAITSVIGYLIFIPLYSYFGAAYVTIYSELAISLASFFLVYRNTKFIPNLEVLIKSALASLVMFASIYGTYLFITSNLLLVLTIAIITYFVFLIIFRGLKKADLLVLINK